MQFPEISSGFYQLSENKVLKDFILILVALLVVVILSHFLKKLIETQVKDSSLRYKSKKLIGVFAFIVFTFFISIAFYDKLGKLTIIFGLTGAGVAFALQDVLISFAAWLSITFNNIFKTGDRIQLGGVMGDVIDIGVLRTTLMECGAWVDGDLYNGRIVKLSNSNIFKVPVYNYSLDFPFLWDEVKIQIRHGSSIQKTREIIENIANAELLDYAKQAQDAWNKVTRKYLIENAQVEPLLTMIADENFMIFTLRYVVAYNKRRITQSLLFEEIVTEIEKYPNEVSIASASFDINRIPVIKFDNPNVPL